MHTWCLSLCLVSLALVFACVICGSVVETNSMRTMQHDSRSRLFATSNNTGEEGESTNKCGTDFHAEATTNGEAVCVFDYDDDAATLEEVAAAAIEEVVDEAAFQQQNKARRNFGVPSLTPMQCISLQADTKQIIPQQMENVAATDFRDFDENGDGEAIVSKVMAHFDSNGDGLLQPEEFVPIEELRTLLREVIESDGSDAPPQQQQQTQVVPEEEAPQKQQPQGIFPSFFQTIYPHTTCQSNADCARPKVCCDFGYKKTCCTGGEGQLLTPAMAYATIPSMTPQSSPPAGDTVDDKW